MNRYKFVATTLNQPTKEAVQKAKVLTDIDEILNANASPAPYVFEESKELTEKLRKASALEILVDTLNSGALVNRAKATYNGKTQRLRTYGNGRENIVPAKVFTADEISKAVFGFCKSDGEIVTEEVFNQSTGEVIKRPVIYLFLS